MAIQKLSASTAMVRKLAMVVASLKCKSVNDDMKQLSITLPMSHELANRTQIDAKPVRVISLCKLSNL